MKLQSIAVLLFSIFMLTACDDGPAERMGERIDEAATDAGNAVEDVCEDVSGRNC